MNRCRYQMRGSIDFLICAILMKFLAESALPGIGLALALQDKETISWSTSTSIVSVLTPSSLFGSTIGIPTEQKQRVACMR